MRLKPPFGLEPFLLMLMLVAVMARRYAASAGSSPAGAETT